MAEGGKNPGDKDEGKAFDMWAEYPWNVKRPRGDEEDEQSLSLFSNPQQPPIGTGRPSTLQAESAEAESGEGQCGEGQSGEAKSAKAAELERKRQLGFEVVAKAAQEHAQSQSQLQQHGLQAAAVQQYGMMGGALVVQSGGVPGQGRPILGAGSIAPQPSRIVPTAGVPLQGPQILQPPAVGPAASAILQTTGATLQPAPVLQTAPVPLQQMPQVVNPYQQNLQAFERSTAAMFAMYHPQRVVSDPIVAVPQVVVRSTVVEDDELDDEMREVHEQLAAMQKQLSDIEQRRKKKQDKKKKEVVEYFYQFRGPHPPGRGGGTGGYYTGTYSLSAINFEYDRVIDADLRTMKDLLKSNICEVSQSSNESKVISMKGSYCENDKGARGVACNLKSSDDIEEYMNKDKVNCYPEEHIPKVDESDTKTCPDGVLGKSPKTCDVNSKAKFPECEKVNSSSNGINGYFELNNSKCGKNDQCFHCVHSNSKVGKKNGFCENDLTNCVQNFVLYTDYLIESVHGWTEAKNGYSVPPKSTYHRELENYIICDVKEALLHLNENSRTNGYDERSEQCIVCSLVEMKKCTHGFVNEYISKWNSIVSQIDEVNGYGSQDLSQSHPVHQSTTKNLEVVSVEHVDNYLSNSGELSQSETDTSSSLSTLTAESLSTEDLCAEHFAAVQHVPPFIVENLDPLVIDHPYSIAIDINGVDSEMIRRGGSDNSGRRIAQCCSIL